MSATADIEADEQNISHDHECVKDEKPTSEIRYMRSDTPSLGLETHMP
jgi:hypothetical protein